MEFSVSEIITLVLVALMGAGVIWFVRRGPKEEKEETYLKQDIDSLRREMREEISSTKEKVDRSFEKSTETYAKLQKELGSLQEMGGHMKRIQEFLASPKIRGNLGEQILQDILEQIIPRDYFNTQYEFKGGGKVDAVIKTSQGLVAIDSKFPMESFREMAKAKSEEEKKRASQSFRRYLKSQITEVASKYILPQEGTVDFAIIYVPSEAAYYDIITKRQDVLDYGYEKKVYFVSPNTFYYFLKIIMVGLQGAKIEESAKQILNSFKAIRRESDKLGEDLQKLEKHLDNARSAGEKVGSRYHKLSGRIDAAEQLGAQKKELESKDDS